MPLRTFLSINPIEPIVMRLLTPPSSLSGSHLRTYEKIYQHPVTHSLPWRDVLTLFSHLGEITLEVNGNVKVKHNGHTLVFSPPSTKEITEVDEIMKLRHFLEQSEAAAPAIKQPETLMLLVINHQQARLFRAEVRESVPQQIIPHNLPDSFRQAHPSRDFFDGKEKPAPGDFFEPVAQALKQAAKILIFGSGTGISSEMYQFIIWLKKHQPELARRIIGMQVVDEHHLTDAELLAKAREFCGTSPKTLNSCRC